MLRSKNYKYCQEYIIEYNLFLDDLRQDNLDIIGDDFTKKSPIIGNIIIFILN
jgi:hypothetical protein